MRLKKFEMNLKGNDYVIGDVHGAWHLVENEMEANNFDQEVDRLFSVGDLVDRGPHSEEAVRWMDKPWFHAVRGNHEQMAIDTFNGNFPSHVYMHNGGAWFLSMQKAEQQYYVDAFESLPWAIEVETQWANVGIVHAEVPDDDWAKVEDAYQDRGEPSMLWGRGKIFSKNTDRVENIDHVYVGHTPLKTVTVLGNVFYIDTGAVYPDGHLTIMKIN